MPASLIISEYPTSRDYLLELVDCAKLFPQVSCVRNSREALEVLREQPVQVIFFDWDARTKKEFKALAGELHNRDEWCDIPLIIFTTEGDKETELFALEHGASDCLRYGTTSRELAVRLSPHLNHKKRADALREENTQLAKLAISDRLTNLYNRSYFDLILEFEAVRSRRQGTKLSLLVVTIDRLSQLIERYGHSTGDSLLRLVGDVIDDTVRQSDIPCRFSHQEFAIILPDTGAPDAYTLAERIRKEVSRRGPKPPVNPFQLSVSIGISGTVVASAVDPARLIDEAFCAVGVGRRQGSNRTEIFCQTTQVRTLEGYSLDLDTPQGHA